MRPDPPARWPGGRGRGPGRPFRGSAWSRLCRQDCCLRGGGRAVCPLPGQQGGHAAGHAASKPRGSGGQRAAAALTQVPALRPMSQRDPRMDWNGLRPHGHTGIPSSSGSREDREPSAEESFRPPLNNLLSSPSPPPGQVPRGVVPVYGGTGHFPFIHCHFPCSESSCVL